LLLSDRGCLTQIFGSAGERLFEARPYGVEFVDGDSVAQARGIGGLGFLRLKRFGRPMPRRLSSRASVLGVIAPSR
jgi:hypothetical protein